MRIDSHHHFWNYSQEQYGWINRDMEILRRDFSAADLLREIEAVEVAGVVSVQAGQSELPNTSARPLPPCLHRFGAL